jgi:outer membrane protein assembly factor BamB
MKLILTIFFLSCLIRSNAQNIAQWRGVNRDGIYNEENLLKTWPENGPAMLWVTEEIGKGYGAPVVTSNRVFVNGETEGQSYLFAFGLDGKLIWKSPNGAEFTGQDFNSKFPGSRSAPTVIDNLVYSISGIGRIACYNIETGTEQWAANMETDLSGIPTDFGYTESPLIDGDKLFCYPGGATSNVVALNRFTGKPIWVSKALGDSVSFCSPMLIKLPKRDVLATFSTCSIFGLDANTGELLWSQKQEIIKYKQQCNTPVFSDGYLYYDAGDGNGAVKLELTPDGGSYKQVWRNDNVKNNFQGFVKLGNTIYCPDKAQKLYSLDCETGQIQDTLKVKRGSLIAADGLLFCYSDNGTVSLIDRSGSKMKITGSLKIEKGSMEHFAHPVIQNGVMYIRHGNALMAYQIK